MGTGGTSCYRLLWKPIPLRAGARLPLKSRDRHVIGSQCHPVERTQLEVKRGESLLPKWAEDNPGVDCPG